jgi:hypothetical protein
VARIVAEIGGFFQRLLRWPGGLFVLGGCGAVPESTWVKDATVDPGNPMPDQNPGFVIGTFAQFEIFFSHRIAFGYDGRFWIVARSKAISSGPMATSCYPPEGFRPLGGFCP